ncbi:hypothetical protein [Candidatus Cyanaurora vandensis]|uniref:hypothetical protein n=1 Tax=Candidatus Cyanaurora vandensis TaxID=2714958 RepID=UPI00257B1CE6|nr:hypothetical protein [Candidatus Cyanaurora vandensis]
MSLWLRWSLCFALLLPVQAQSRDLQTQVEGIRSVSQVKGQLKGLLESQKECGVGICVDALSTGVCDLVGALDIRVDGKIIGEASGFTDKVLPITAPDLKLMKLIWSQCKPTNYLYTNYPSVVHVGYNPSAKAAATVDKALKVAP